MEETEQPKPMIIEHIPAHSCEALGTGPDQDGRIEHRRSVGKPPATGNGVSEFRTNKRITDRFRSSLSAT